MNRVSLGLLVMGTIVVAAEMVLRMQYSDLPSMSGAMRPFVPAERPAVLAIQDDIEGCVETDSNGEPPTAWRLQYGDADRPSLRILVVGDSVTLGQGVEPSVTYGARLGSAIAASTGSTVEVVNGAVNAAGYCGVFRSMHHHHAHGSFDWTVVALFADDLEQRAVLLEGDRIRANPAALSGWVANAATHSYAFNAVWYSVVSQAVQRLAQSDDPLPPHITRPGRSVPPSTIANLRKSIALAAPIEPIFVLLPPVGSVVCSTDSDPTSECGWMQSDLERMADVLHASGVEWFDLRSYPTPEHQLKSEQREWRRDGRLPVHPNDAGHGVIADALQGRFTSR